VAESSEFVMSAHQVGTDAGSMDTFAAIVIAIAIVALVFTAMALALVIFAFIVSLF